MWARVMKQKQRKKKTLIWKKVLKPHFYSPLPSSLNSAARQQQQAHSASATNVLNRCRFHSLCQTVMMATCSCCLHYVIHTWPRAIGIHALLPSRCHLGNPESDLPKRAHFLSLRFLTLSLGSGGGGKRSCFRSGLVFCGKFASDDLGTAFEWGASTYRVTNGSGGGPLSLLYNNIPRRTAFFEGAVAVVDVRGGNIVSAETMRSGTRRDPAMGNEGDRPVSLYVKGGERRQCTSRSDTLYAEHVLVDGTQCDAATDLKFVLVFMKKMGLVSVNLPSSDPVKAVFGSPRLTDLGNSGYHTRSGLAQPVMKMVHQRRNAEKSGLSAEGGTHPEHSHRMIVESTLARQAAPCQSGGKRRPGDTGVMCDSFGMDGRSGKRMYELVNVAGAAQLAARDEMSRDGRISWRLRLMQLTSFIVNDSEASVHQLHPPLRGKLGVNLKLEPLGSLHNRLGLNGAMWGRGCEVAIGWSAVTKTVTK
ncbi:hypothetical protein BGW80DRAFT_1252756 [Lactifluus volemus]|nr:hypothetical protein BGW80DRAFT_1252756 [Lactifluus volemus]